MNDTAQSVVAEKFCANCGARADVGLIFCKKCGATLRPPAPFISSPAPDAKRPRTITAKAIVLVFSLCAVADFIFGYIHERSVPAGVISVVGGLFGTAFYLLVLKWFWNGSDQTGRS
jgi:ribosomal protein L40E